ncbi:MAG: DNA repair and recombination protein RadA [archaeon]
MLKKKVLTQFEFLCPNELLRQEQKRLIVDTGSNHLNALLKGGFRLNEITEVYGSFNSGKSQLGFTLCVNLLKLDESFSTLFLDTEASFRSSRIVEIAKGKGIDENKALNSIRLLRIKSTKEQVEIIEKLGMVLEAEPSIKLIIIDSLIAHLRAEYLGREQLVERQQILANMLHKLGDVVERYKVGVYLTNQVATDPNKYFGDPTIALGGNVLAHFSQTRLYFRSGKKGKKVAKVTDSSCIPEGEAIFEIRSEGITD